MEPEQARNQPLLEHRRIGVDGHGDRMSGNQLKNLLDPGVHEWFAADQSELFGHWLYRIKERHERLKREHLIAVPSIGHAHDAFLIAGLVEMNVILIGKMLQDQRSPLPLGNDALSIQNDISAPARPCSPVGQQTIHNRKY